MVLPAYNEEKTIASSVEQFHKVLPNAYIVVVNNASTDNTRQIAEEVLSKYKVNGVVLNEERPGKANAVKLAFRMVNAEKYLMCDADLTYPISDADKLLKLLDESQADIVVGDRLSNGSYHHENNRRFHGLGNNIVRSLINLIYRKNLKDIMSGYRGMSHRFVRNYPILVEGFQLETDMTLHAVSRGFKIFEEPINYQDRPEGSFSKLNTFRDGANVLMTIFNIFRLHKPLLFFGLIALIMAVVGLVVAIPVFSDWVHYKHIYHVPTAILASGIELIAFLSFFVGLILENHSHYQKFLYEQRIMDYDFSRARS